MPEEDLCQGPCGYSGRPGSPLQSHMLLKDSAIAQGGSPGFHVNTRASKLSSTLHPG
jgi:hypothetical protein